jgi:hypothetical protein
MQSGRWSISRFLWTLSAGEAESDGRNPLAPRAAPADTGAARPALGLTTIVRS